MNQDPFFASFENIKRAKTNFDKLKATNDSFVQSEPYALRVKREGKAFYIIACLRNEVPDDFAWELVDVVLRLRASLDKACVALVEGNGRGVSGAAFPFGGVDRRSGQPTRYPDERMEKGIKKKLTAAQWAVIERYRPYPGGNDTLWSVNEIANSDKHRNQLVEARCQITGGVGVGPGPLCGYYRGGGTITFPSGKDHVLANKEKDVVVAFNDGTGFNEKVNVAVAPEIVFRNVAAVAGKPVLGMLYAQMNMVESVVSDLRGVL